LFAAFCVMVMIGGSWDWTADIEAPSVIEGSRLASEQDYGET